MEYSSEARIEQLIEQLADLIPDYPENEEKYNHIFEEITDITTNSLKRKIKIKSESLEEGELTEEHCELLCKIINEGIF